jgi:hypothetical protein
MAGNLEPAPLPRNDVRRIYDTMAHSATPLTLSQVTAQCPQYSAGQVYWACGTMTRQAIIRPQPAARSDRANPDPAFDVLLPFEENYIGWEDAK